MPTSFCTGFASKRPTGSAHIFGARVTSASPSQARRPRSLSGGFFCGTSGNLGRGRGVSAAAAGLTCASRRLPHPAPSGRPPPPRPGPAHWLTLGGEEKGRPRGSH
ncbi:unnamed protein product [Rangifer tarandus platyrhynchus]|uniref:Uncharacterized protein n=1 Tax=Rangifer tarandus platyrhynchus TaxID=3082113 RepID=A0ABN8ZE47_RANTA|nr:unnamed protein product [Rangifer tarandus platyrhynchus]